MYVDEVYGGLGVDDFCYDQILMEEIIKYSLGFFLLLYNCIVGLYFQKFDIKEQKDCLMSGIVFGDRIFVIVIIESGMGLDMVGICMWVEDMGDYWVLNGFKIYILNGLILDVVFVVVCIYLDNLYVMGFFIVEVGMEGFQCGWKFKKFGLYVQDMVELFFEDVKILKENVLGDFYKGFKYMMFGFVEECFVGVVVFMG